MNFTFILDHLNSGRHAQFIYYWSWNKCTSTFKQYKFQAHFDFLTGIYNRRKFEEITQTLFQQAANTPHFQFALIYMDIDHFKTINDQYGHHEGDQVLKELASRLKHSIRNTDPAARIGGEEFAVLLPNCTLNKAVQIAERIRRAVSDEPVRLTNGEELSVTISLGPLIIPIIRNIQNPCRFLPIKCSTKRKKRDGTKYVFQKKEWIQCSNSFFQSERRFKGRKAGTSSLGIPFL